MNIRTLGPANDRRIEIAVSGKVNPENAKGIIQRALFETTIRECSELILDLRKANLENEVSAFRLHALLQVFRSVVLQRCLRLMVLLPWGGDDEQWTNITRAKEFDGLSMQVFNSRETAYRYLGKALREARPTIH